MSERFSRQEDENEEDIIVRSYMYVLRGRVRKNLHELPIPKWKSLPSLTFKSRYFGY